MKTSLRILASTGILAVLTSAGAAFGQAIDAQVQTPAQTPAAQPQPAQPPAQGQPQLVFDTLEHDFGRIPDTDPVEYKFRFVNRGSGVLKFFVPLQASCGCTAGNPRSPKNPDVDQTEFGPGEEGFIKVSFAPAGKHGDVNQRVTVRTNDPQQPEQILKIHAFVRTTVAFDPPLVSFGEVRTGEVAKQIVKVTGPAGFQVPYASTSKGRYITVKVLGTEPVTIDGEQMSQSTLELTFTGKAPRGTLNAVATVRTNNEQFPLADVQVMAEVVGDLQVLPPRVNVGIIDAGQQFTKMFRVNSRSGKPFKILDVAQRSNLAQPLEINVSPVETGNETAYQVEVKGQGPSNPSPINATLTLTTDNPSDQTLEVMLSGAVRPQMARPAPTPTTNPVGPAVTPSPANDVEPKK